MIVCSENGPHFPFNAVSGLNPVRYACAGLHGQSGALARSGE